MKLFKWEKRRNDGEKIGKLIIQNKYWNVESDECAKCWMHTNIQKQAQDAHSSVISLKKNFFRNGIFSLFGFN